MRPGISGWHGRLEPVGVPQGGKEVKSQNYREVRGRVARCRWTRPGLIGSSVALAWASWVVEQVGPWQKRRSSAASMPTKEMGPP